MKKLSLIVLVLFAVASLPASGWAASPWTTKTEGKVMGKLGFGVKNLLLGWTEILKEPVHHFRDAKENRFGQGLIGLGVGLYHGVYDTVGGALHLITFPVTSIDVPLPHDGVVCPFGKGCPLNK